MVFDHAQSPRLGQPTPVESTSVRIFTGSEIPEAAWEGQMIYRSDLQVLQVFDGTAWEDVVGGVAGLLTFVGDDPPIAQNVGDLWFDSNDGNKLYRWDGFSWVSVNPDQELDVSLVNGGRVYVPSDGTVAQFDGITSNDGVFTDMTVTDYLSVLGVNNRIGGALQLDSNILPPSDPPSVSDVDDDSFIALSAPSTAYVGLGDNGTSWETGWWPSGGKFAFPSGSGSTEYDYTIDLRVRTIDKVTGVMSEKWTASALPIFTYTDNGFANIPNPIVTSFHSTANNVMFMVYVPAFTASSGTKGAAYFVVWLSSSGVFHNSWQWSSYSAYRYPALYTDDTYTYVTATHKSDNKVYTFRYNNGGTGGTQIGLSSIVAGADWNALYVGNADFGSQRFVMSYPGQTVHVWNGNTFSGTEAWTRSADVQIRGLVWDGTHFYTHHTDSKIRKYSTRTAQTTNSFTYTWYKDMTDVGGGVIESTPSDPLVHTTPARKWGTVITAAIPVTSDASAPDSVRIYADNHLQGTPATLGRTNYKYEILTTGGAAAPTTDGFLAVDGFGRVISEALNDLDDPATEFRGNGYWRLDPTRDLGDTGWLLVGATGNAPFENSWVNYSSGYNALAYRKKMGVVYIQGLVKDGAVTNVPIFTLPLGMRPAFAMIFPGIINHLNYVAPDPDVAVYDVAVRVNVNNNGTVTVSGNNSSLDNGYLSLSGISFVVD